MNTTGDTTATHPVAAPIVAAPIVAVRPGLTPRLLREDAAPESLDAYLAAGGYRDLPAATKAATKTATGGLLDAVEQSGLRGRGGAAFPFAVKARSVHRMARRGLAPVVVANGEEGEPASVKDRWLLRNRPHLVLDGLRLAAAEVGAGEAYVYVSDPGAAQSVTAALKEAEAGARLAVKVRVTVVEPGYVAGEETAAVRAINGGPAKPADKPPRPFEAGVADRPTLVSNVETLANLPFIRRHGPARYREQGTEASPGTFLATVTGGAKPPALYELPYGMPFRELLKLHKVPEASVHGLLMGGYFSGLLGPEAIGMTLDYESARAAGAGLGCGAVSILAENDCPVAVAASVMAYFARENAGQCGSCFNGTAAMSAVLDALRDGVAAEADLERLRRWSQVLRGRGACGTLDGAVNLAASLLAQFPATVDQHLAGGCDRCGASPLRAARPYEVEAVTLA
jgi:NADH:ubiquinone oxidoreductase subunit F (NADH-binding)